MMSHRRLVVAITSLALPLCSIACVIPADLKPTASALGEIDDALASFELSSTNDQLSPKVTAAYNAFDQSMLVPSYIYGDSSIWTTLGTDSRILTVTGTFHDGRYDVQADSTAPAAVGASRRIVHLQRFTREQFRWTAMVEQAVGSLPVQDIDRAAHTLLEEAAQMSSSALRTAEASRYPRTGAVLGRLLSLDDLTTTRTASRTRVRLVVGVHIAGIASTYPHYASALRTEIGAARAHVAAIDDQGAEWFRLDFDGSHLTIELAATASGRPAPLTGAVRSLPDSLTVMTDYSTKAWMFTVGVRNLVSHVSLFDRPHVYGFHAAFRQEPTWVFPLTLDRLVTKSLARPFADSGAEYEIVIADTLGAQTEFRQTYAFDVEESPILRWLDKINAQLNNAFSEPATAEANAYLANVMASARADLRADEALASRQRGQ